MAKILSMVSKSDSYDTWQCDDDCRTVERAYEIISDPKKWPAVKAKLAKKAKVLKEMAGVFGKLD